MSDTLLVFSANNPESLEQTSTTIVKDLLDNGKDKVSAAWTLQVGRRELPYRRYFVWGQESPQLDKFTKEYSPVHQAKEDAGFVLELGDQLEDLVAMTKDVDLERNALAIKFNQEKRACLAYFATDQRKKINKAIFEGSQDIDIKEGASFVLQYALCQVIKMFSRPEGCQGSGLGVLAYECAFEDLSIEEALKDFSIKRERKDQGNYLLSLKKQGDLRSDSCISFNELKEEHVLDAIGHLWSRGIAIQWENLYKERPRKIRLPKYVFKKIQFPANFKANRSNPSQEEQVQRKDGTDLSLEEVKDQLLKIWKEILGVDKVSDKEDFIEIGGDSLSVARLNALIRETFSISLDLKTIYDNLQFGSLAKLVHENLKGQKAESKIPDLGDKEYYETSHAQKRMYAVQQINPETVAYNLATCYQVDGNLDTNYLNTCLNKLIDTHEALRTSFHVVDGEIVQKINEGVENILDQRWLGEDEDLVLQELTEPFDLSLAPLFRVKLLKRSDDQSYLFIDMHHVIGDQTSIDILMGDLESLFKGEDISKPSLRYVDYASWHNKEISSKSENKDLDFWLKELEASPESLYFVEKAPKAEGLESDGKYFQEKIPEDLRKKLKDFTENHHLTQYTVFMGAYALLLSHYGGRKDVVIGTAVAGRNQSSLEDIVGMFVNTLPLRVRLDYNQESTAYLTKVKELMINALSHQEVPLDIILDNLAGPNQGPNTPLFNMCLNYVNMGTDELEIPGLNLTPIPSLDVDAKYDLMLTIEETEEDLSLDVEYRPSLYSEKTIRTFINRYLILVDSLLSSQDQPIGRLAYVEAQELEGLKSFNDTETNAPLDKNCIHLFEERVKACPDKPALTWQNITLNYKEVNNRANWLAEKLYGAGVKKGDHVGLLLDQGLEQVVSILALLKLGAVYVPIAPDYPQDRIEYILKDGQVKVCLITRGYEEKIKDIPYKVVDLENFTVVSDSIEFAQGPKDLSGEDEMYILFTSGSTGRPKGVVLRHKGVIRTVLETNFYHITEEDRVTQMVNYTFDPSVMEIFGGLLNGAHIYIIPKDLLMDFPNFADYLQENQITQSIFITPVFHLLVNYNPQALSSYKKVFIGGEALNTKHAKKAMEVIGPKNVVNLYGPTEGSITASYYMVNKMSTTWDSVPIGKPINGCKLYVVDEDLNPLPSGIAGELVITGPGVAKGYMNRDDLNKTKFVNLAFLEGERGYRTGDKVYLDQDLELRFMGRIDAQVKINGFRIELDEIKNALLKIPGVVEAAVRVNKDRMGQQVMEAYYVLDEKTTLEARQVAGLLGQVLPGYMVPSRIMEMDRLPLTANNKIDLKNLPEISEPVQSSKKVEKSPEAKAQRKESPKASPKEIILEEMKKVLDSDEIGATDDFFNFGGQSIRAIALCQELKSRGIDLSVHDIFTYRTADLLAKKCGYEEDKTPLDGSDSLEGDSLDVLIKTCIKEGDEFARSLAAGEIVKEFSLSPIQRLHLSRDSETTFFTDEIHCPGQEELKKRVLDLISSQDLLRSLLGSNNKWALLDLGQDRKALEDKFKILDLRPYNGQAGMSILSGLISILKDKKFTHNEPLWRLFIGQVDEDKYVVVWVIDHLIFDGMSAEVLKKGLEGLDQPHGRYEEYVEFLDEGPSVPEEEIYKLYPIEEWFTDNHEVIGRLEKVKLDSPMKLTIHEHIDKSINNPWLQGYHILKKVLQEEVGNTKIPMLLLNYGRSYCGKNFYHCAGEFLDFVPFYADETGIEETLEDQVEKIQTYGLNFMWLLLRGDETGSYRKISKSLQQVYDKGIFNAAVLNYQGYVNSGQQIFYDENEREEVNLVSNVYTMVSYDSRDVLKVEIMSKYGFTQRQRSLFSDSEIKEIRIKNQEDA